MVRSWTLEKGENPSETQWSPPIRPPRFRLRTLLFAVVAAALLIWSAMMGTRAYVYYRRAQEFSIQERGWREIASRGHFRPEFCWECVDYFAQLSLKYRRAMWHPWSLIGPDPHAPGYDRWLEQERRAKEIAPDSAGAIPPSPDG